MRGEPTPVPFGEQIVLLQHLLFERDGLGGGMAVVVMVIGLLCAPPAAADQCSPPGVQAASSLPTNLAKAAKGPAEDKYTTATVEPLTALGHQFQADTPELGAATAIEFTRGGGLIASAEPVRRGGGAAAVVNPRRVGS